MVYYFILLNIKIHVLIYSVVPVGIPWISCVRPESDSDCDLKYPHKPNVVYEPLTNLPVSGSIWATLIWTAAASLAARILLVHEL